MNFDEWWSKQDLVGAHEEYTARLAFAAAQAQQREADAVIAGNLPASALANAEGNSNEWWGAIDIAKQAIAQRIRAGGAE